jgi:hypothetical protein
VTNKRKKIDLNIEEYLEDIENVKLEISDFQRNKKELEAITKSIPFEDIDQYMLAFRKFLRLLEYPYVKMHRREKERLIVAKNHELKQELYWFLDDTEHLAEIELENFQTWINHLRPVDAHVVYPDFEENIPNKLRRQSKKYGFDIFVYDILIVEGAKMLSFLETIIAKEKELLRNIKAMIKLIKASQEVETRILN